MRARRRQLRLATGDKIDTPLLVPSFSSKGFHLENVNNILAYMEGIITDQVLVSAYDIHYRKLKRRLTFPSNVFLDSGGYEASVEVELSDVGKDVHRPNRWTKEYHESAVRNWKFDVPTVIISFDSPRVRVPVEQQIRRAATFFQKFPMAAGEILFKPEKMRGRYVSIDRIIANVHDLANFAAIGFTEKELGDSTLARMINIAAVRDALSRAGLGMPLHIFGSLDPISSPLYFLAGADIFDGLTWLRYAFDRGRAVYKHNYISHAMGVQLEDFRVNAKVWNDNYYYMERLKNEMIRYARTGDLCEFEHNRDLFKVAWTHCDEQLAGKG